MPAMKNAGRNYHNVSLTHFPHLAIAAGNSRARLFVDASRQPGACLVWDQANNVYCVGGDPGAAAFWQEVGDALRGHRDGRKPATSRIWHGGGCVLCHPLRPHRPHPTLGHVGGQHSLRGPGGEVRLRAGGSR